MQYTPEEIRQYAAEEDVKFIRMAFCDVEGRQKNIAIYIVRFAVAPGAWQGGADVLRRDPAGWYGDRGGRPQSFEKGRGRRGGGGFDLYLRHGNGILPVLPG